MFGSMEDENYREQLKRRAMALLDYNIDGDDKHLHLVQQLNNYILEQHKPQNLNMGNPDNEFFKMSEAFENLCAIMEEHHVTDPANMPVYSLYKRLEYLEKRHKKK